MLSEKAIKEIESIKSKIFSLEKEEYQLKIKRRENPDLYTILEKEIFKINDKIYKYGDKIREIEKGGFSTLEIKQIFKESENFIIVEKDKSMGIINYTKIGYSKVVNTLIKVNTYKYTSLMSNVRGCSSLANKKGMDSFKVITKETFDEYCKRGKIDRVNFCGVEEKIIPISNPGG